MVRTLAVTSSPTCPSPRVNAWTSRPSSYRSEHDNPSIFGSAVSATGASSASFRNRRTRATNSSTSSSANALSRLIIAFACATFARWPAGAAPTARLGESLRTAPGNAASIAALRRTSASYSASLISGASSV